MKNSSTDMYSSTDNKMKRLTLAEIGRSYNCDKFVRHHFDPVYERHFSEIRDHELRILEIGIGGESYEDGGASLKTWADYFANSHVFGIDIYDKTSLNGPRISTFVCDQGDQSALWNLAEEHGPFDIVIDDGSHHSDKTLLSLFALFGHLKPGGMYVIEDIQTAYWPQYGGSSVMGPFKETTMTWIKTMLDCVNRCEILWPDHPALKCGFKAEEVHVYHNIAIIKKEINASKSQVLDDDLRQEWLTLDMNIHATNEKLADLLNSHPSAMTAIGKMLFELNAIHDSLTQSDSEQPT
jgi:2-polyprenyl-3-methyl-5-hydroxy-6-metoxy-1,4-benzoquinol methylase